MSNYYFVELRDMAENQEPYWAVSSAQEPSHLQRPYHVCDGYRYWGIANNPGEAMRNARRRRRADLKLEDDD